MLARWIIFHIVSGQAFFSGAVCLLAAIGLSCREPKGWARVPRNLLACLGAILVFLSAAPLPTSAYLILCAVSLIWVTAEGLRGRIGGRQRGAVRGLAAIAWAAGVVAEAPSHLSPSVPTLGRPTLGIVGDSVTAGTGGPADATWPGVLASRRGIAVRDHSAMGATVASAMRQAGAISGEERLVLLEIGGNDLLGGVTAEAFEAGLEGLLRAICRPGREVVMLELPLPPTYNAYGRAQRRLARRYGVRLVPRRVLLGVLQGDGLTLDSIHLSREGHRRMAEAIWSVLRGAYQAED